MSVFDEIRSSCRYLAEQAEFVSIDQDFLDEYARQLPIEVALNPVMETENHFCGDAEQTLAYFITLDSINFGSGYFDSLRLDKDKTGYFTVASRLKAESIRLGGFSAAWLCNVDVAACCRIFEQNLADPLPGELMRLFAEALNQLGRLLEDQYDGSFTSFIETAGFSAASLVEQLLAMPFYRDVFEIAGRKISLLKRAQITASDLHIAFSGQGYGRFDDIAELTIFADNLVPHVLLTDGLIKYRSDLLQAISAGQPLISGSRAEVEIRACTVHAVELLRQVYAAAGVRVNSQGLDYLLWNRGQERKYRQSPTHITRCVYY
ncbi:MAG: hypothetical protein GQF41_2425 [Candidatus Rifleibacterium amylolyticum]|nr:MAG: hypothetical protein GQF41_2425 [Candidatus Rifleibacterium amylolyticum]